MPYRDFLPKRKKSLEVALSQQEAKKAAEDALSEAEKNWFIQEDSLVNDEYDEEWQDWLTELGLSVQKWIGGAGNQMRNDGTVSRRFTCQFKNGL